MSKEIFTIVMIEMDGKESLGNQNLFQFSPFFFFYLGSEITTNEEIQNDTELDD